MRDVMCNIRDDFPINWNTCQYLKDILQQLHYTGYYSGMGEGLKDNVVILRITNDIDKYLS